MDTNVTTPQSAAPAAPPLPEAMEERGEQPKRYIRTFAGDMAILKSGGVPDLVPLKESKPSPIERLVAPSPIASPMTSEPIPVPEPVPSPVLQPIQPPEPIAVSPIETYASDFSEKMKKEDASTATVLAAEQDATSQRSQPKQSSSRGNLLYVLAGLILLIAGGCGAYIAYLRYSTSLAPVTLTPTVSAPIFVDEREQISGTGVVLFQAIEQSISRPLASGAVRLLYTEGATTTDNSIFSALQTSAPGILLRNVNAEGSMAGIINVGGTQSPFFILSVASYSDTFSGMLSWEPLMPNDLAALFPPYPTPISNVSIATSTSATMTTKTVTKTIKKTTTRTVAKIATTTVAIPPAPVFIAGFYDEVVNNHDVRVYRDAENRSVLLYGYWNQTTLIIARDSVAFAEILQRLATSHTQQ
ncbi:MAG: hypothetical protein ABSB00_01605 [Minisyncoccia bacterium]|jgi:hypothetical protein